jgi:hypothetical protein
MQRVVLFIPHHAWFFYDMTSGVEVHASLQQLKDMLQSRKKNLGFAELLEPNFGILNVDQYTDSEEKIDLLL